MMNGFMLPRSQVISNSTKSLSIQLVLIRFLPDYDYLRNAGRGTNATNVTYVATRSVRLKTHKENQHHGIRYPCNECTYVAMKPGCLTKHRINVHAGVRHPCDLCKYTGADPGRLKQHKEAKHVGIGSLSGKSGSGGSDRRNPKTQSKEKIKLPCDQCGYSATRRTNLKRHIKNKHKI